MDENGNWNEMLKEFQERIDYFFSDQSLLEIALTHSSYVNETSLLIKHNERLEFLGDSVVGLFFSEELFRRFASSQEGELTHMRSKLVRGESLGILAREMGLDKYLRLGKGEEMQGGRLRTTLLANAFEAVVGAVFLDGGYIAVQKLIGKFTETSWETPFLKGHNKDNKSLLQEFTQQKFKGLPYYTLLEATGPEHQKIFKVAVTLPNGKTLEATGTTVKKAEQISAGLAIESLLSNS